MGDVDDLLAELDAELAAPSAKGTGQGAAQQQRRQRERTPGNAVTITTGDDIDALLADLDAAEPMARPKQPVPPSNASSKSSAAAASSVAGVSFPSRGGSSSMGEHVSGLRCSKCDFRVLRFVDSLWADDADYMFFRNHMPDVRKLQAKMQSRDGFCAYACQCSWASAELGAPHGVSHWFMAR